MITGRGNTRRRLGLSLLVIIVALSVFGGRLVQLQAIQGGAYRQVSKNLRLRTFDFPALRGEITAAGGQVLAMTVQTDLVYADPVEMTKAQMPQVADTLAGPLNMSAASILQLLQHPTSPQYVVLEKGVSAAAGNKIASMTLPGTTTKLPGIAMTASYQRTYPDGSAAADVLGFTNTDSSGNLVGEAGIEAAENKVLAGRAGVEHAQVSTGGQPIPLAVGEDTSAVNGSNVRLTIVPALQWEAQQACAAEVKKSGAKNCTVVIMQPHTGDILAMSQWPAYDPTDPTSSASTSDLAVQDVFTPGSTGKVMTAAAALERGGQTIESPYKIPDQITIDGRYTFHDAETHPTERLTIAGILAYSSNVGMVQVAQHINPKTQYHYLKAFGIGQATGLGLPGETPGLLPALKDWWGDERYTLAFGQGVAVNAVQMASVYATIANGGVRAAPTLVDGTMNAAGHFSPASPASKRRVLTAKTAHALVAAMQQVPGADASAGEPWGVIPGYAVAAKTGTSQEWNSKQKCLCSYGASYIGMAPGNNPKLVVAVNVQDPSKGQYYGDVVAGPVFSQVTRFALQTLKIPPDGAQPPKVKLTAK